MTPWVTVSRATLGLIIFLGVASEAAASTENGWSAYLDGDCRTAVTELRREADAAFKETQ